MTNVINYIKEQGGILSGELAAYIETSENINNDAARKRVERLTSPIHKLAGLFSEKQTFIYHSDQYKSVSYYEKLKAALQSKGKRYFAIINAIEYHGGVIEKDILANYSFSPLIHRVGHITYSTIIEKLLKLEILNIYDEKHYCLHPFIVGLKEPNFHRYKALQLSKRIIQSSFEDWSRNVGLASYNAGKYNSTIGHFQFSFTSPSYITGLTQYTDKKKKPGFVVSDILNDEKASLLDVDFFLQKVDAIKISSPSTKLFPVLLANGFEEDALKKLKEAGVFLGVIKNLFGHDINDLLHDLISIVTNAGVILKKEPDKYLDLMVNLSKLVDGKTLNLRGDLFEMAVAYYYSTECQFLDLSKIVSLPDDGRKNEIDVLAVYQKKVKAVECKGINRPLDTDYVEKYLSQTIPNIRKWFDKNYSNKPEQIFEIWSTGGFTDEARELLRNAKQKTKKYTIDFLDRTQIIERAKNLESTKFLDILKQYYIHDI